MIIIYFAPDLPLNGYDGGAAHVQGTVNSLEKIVASLENLQYEIKVPKDLADRARRPIERMISIV